MQSRLRDGVVDAISAIAEVLDIARFVREKHRADIEMFYESGYSVHDCSEINGELAEMLRRELGVDARLVSVSPLLDYAVKHFAVLVIIGGRRYIVDAVPELTGLIPVDEAPEEPIIGRESEYRVFFARYL